MLAAVQSTASPPPSRRSRINDEPHPLHCETTGASDTTAQNVGGADGRWGTGKEKESVRASRRERVDGGGAPNSIAAARAPPPNARRWEQRRHRRGGADEPRDAGERAAIELARRGRADEDGGAPHRPCTAGEPPPHRKTTGASTAPSRGIRRAAGCGGASSERPSWFDEDELTKMADAWCHSMSHHIFTCNIL